MNEKVLELLVGLVKLLTRIVIRHLPLTQGESTLLSMRWRLIEDVVGGIDDEADEAEQEKQAIEDLKKKKKNG